MSFNLNISGSEIASKLAVAAICAAIGAITMGFYGHYLETKDHTTILQHVRQSTWATCRLQYELAKRSAGPCYPASADPLIP